MRVAEGRCTVIFAKQHMRGDPLPPLHPLPARDHTEHDITDALWMGVSAEDVSRYAEYFRGEHRPTTERDA